MEAYVDGVKIEDSFSDNNTRGFLISKDSKKSAYVLKVGDQLLPNEDGIITHISQAVYYNEYVQGTKDSVVPKCDYIQIPINEIIKNGSLKIGETIVGFIQSISVLKSLTGKITDKGIELSGYQCSGTPVYNENNTKYHINTSGDACVLQKEINENTIAKLQMLMPLEEDTSVYFERDISMINTSPDNYISYQADLN